MLLNVNPLENSNNVFPQEGVMLHGQSFTTDAPLKRLLTILDSAV
jgi:hypothetical protein